MIDQLLKQYGMNEKEMVIYKFCLANGSSGATKIARNTKINRTTIYSVTSEMINKGLLTRSIINNIAHFDASDPNMLITLAEQKASLVSSNIDIFKSLAQEWSNNWSVTIYKWKSGVMSMYEDILESTCEIKSFLWSFPTDPDVIKFIDKKFYPKKRKKKIYSKTLISTDITLTDWSKDIYNIRERKQKIWIAKNSILNLYGPDKVMFVEFTDKKIFGTITKNKSLYTTMSHVFDYIRNS